MHIPNIWTVEA